MISWVWLDVVAIIFALGIAALGFWRGFVREILVSLAGIIPGVLLGLLWGTAGTWGQGVSLNPDQEGLIRLGSFLFIILFIGYGSALFLPRRPVLWWQHLVGGILGLLNGLLIAAIVFHYVQTYLLRNQTGTVLSGSLISWLFAGLVRWMAWIVLGAIVAVTVAVVVVALVRLGRYVFRVTQQAAAEAAPAAAAAPTISSVGTVPAATPAPAPAPAPEPELPPVAQAMEEPTVPCPNCGQPVAFGAAYCPQCGKVIS